VDAYRFGEFRLDTVTRQLLRNEAPVHLSPKALQLLQTLVAAAPRALSKSELQELLWPGTYVVEANLPHLITEIRTALDDGARSPRFVRTVHGFGYAFQELVVRTSRQSVERVVCLLRWVGGRASLTEGDYVIGRDSAADVVVDSTSVSRRHVRLRVGPGEITVEDLGSKNGSFVGNARVEGLVRLADGDEIRIGMLTVTVRIPGDAGSTETAILDREGTA
jgi:DNA-binding winged helix-turn-helix (wHTH) protein